MPIIKVISRVNRYTGRLRLLCPVYNVTSTKIIPSATYINFSVFLKNNPSSDAKGPASRKPRKLVIITIPRSMSMKD
jgi:hypothetical protein